MVRHKATLLVCALLLLCVLPEAAFSVRAQAVQVVPLRDCTEGEPCAVKGVSLDSLRTSGRNLLQSEAGPKAGSNSAATSELSASKAGSSDETNFGASGIREGRLRDDDDVDDEGPRGASAGGRRLSRVSAVEEGGGDGNDDVSGVDGDDSAAAADDDDADDEDGGGGGGRLRRRRRRRRRRRARGGRFRRGRLRRRAGDDESLDGDGGKGGSEEEETGVTTGRGRRRRRWRRRVADESVAGVEGSDGFDAGDVGRGGLGGLSREERLGKRKQKRGAGEEAEGEGAGVVSGQIARGQGAKRVGTGSGGTSEERNGGAEAARRTKGKSVEDGGGDELMEEIEELKRAGQGLKLALSQDTKGGAEAAGEEALKDEATDANDGGQQGSSGRRKDLGDGFEKKETAVEGGGGEGGESLEGDDSYEQLSKEIAAEAEKETLGDHSGATAEEEEGELGRGLGKKSSGGKEEGGGDEGVEQKELEGSQRLEGERRVGDRVLVPHQHAVAAEEDSGNSGVADEVPFVQGAADEADERGTRNEAEEAAALAAAFADDIAVQFSDEDIMGIEADAHADDEEFNSFMEEMMGIKEKLSPTIQALRAKAGKYMIPRLAKLAKSSRAAFSHTSKSLFHSITPYVGPRFSPLVATLISYSLLLLPLVAIIYLVNTLRVIFSLQKLLLLANLYLSLYCAAVLAACILINGEPMASLQVVAESNFFVLLLLQCFGYILYLGLLFLNVCIASKKKNEPMTMISATFQLGGAAGVGLHYYITVFERSMLDRTPHTSGWAYLVYLIIFFTLTLLSRSGKKNADKDK